MERKWSERSLPLLALGSLGAQSVWSTEMAFAGPFLLHLGMSQSKMAFVFVAGPLSGFLCQPIVGVLTDNSTSKWGRRRPALAIACVLCAASMLLLGFARPLAGILTTSKTSQSSLTIVIVVFSVFCIDFSVNAVNALGRTLILDLVHSKQQSLANVWHARLSGLGGILGFFIGQNNLTTWAPFNWFPGTFASDNQVLDSSEAQLRCVCILVVFLLLATNAVTMIVAKESPALVSSTHRLQVHQSQRQMVFSSLVTAWTSLVKAARGLSRPVLDVFRIQFFLSMAWFPVLFYGTSWISDIARSLDPTMDPAAAMRLGSLAMLFQALFSVTCTLLLPTLLQLYSRRSSRRSTNSLTALWSIAAFSLAVILMSTWFAERTGSTTYAMSTIALTGFAWSLSTWAPHALLGILIQKGLEAQGPGEATRPLSSTSARDVEEDDPLMQRSNSATEQGEDEDYGAEAGGGCTAERRASRSKGSEPRQSGAIAGLHNVSIVLPQFFMTAFSSIVFQLLESKKGAAGQYSTGAANIGLVLRLGGLSAFLSSYYALRLARQHSSILEG